MFTKSAQVRWTYFFHPDCDLFCQNVLLFTSEFAATSCTGSRSLLVEVQCKQRFDDVACTYRYEPYIETTTRQQKILKLLLTILLVTICKHPPCLFGYHKFCGKKNLNSRENLMTRNAAHYVRTNQQMEIWPDLRLMLSVREYEQYAQCGHQRIINTIKMKRISVVLCKCIFTLFQKYEFFFK